MSDWTESTTYETQLAGERPRLVHLCAWLTGSSDAAEDLAQEVLIVAWKNREQLWSPEKLKPWLSGIARNVCLDWSRRREREQARLGYLNDTENAPLDEAFGDDVDLEVDLDRAELAQLLDQALALLPSETAQLLVEHYINESPHAEIAARFNLKPGTVAVRLQRGKLRLQRLLQTRLKEESLAFGLVHPAGLEWEETSIWCPNCGKNRLLGQFQQNQPGGRFALRCPNCDPESVKVGLDLSQPYYAQLLGSVKAYKPAYSRIKTFIATYYLQALAAGQGACPACGQPVMIKVSHGRADAFWLPISERPGAARQRMNQNSQTLIYCPACGWASNSSSTGLALSLPEAQRFWRDNPRIRTLTEPPVESQGVPALVTRLESLTSAATLAVVARRDTFEPLRVYSNTGAQAESGL